MRAAQILLRQVTAQIKHLPANETIRARLWENLAHAIEQFPQELKNNDMRGSACSLLKCAEFGSGTLANEGRMRFRFKPDEGGADITLIQPNFEKNLKGFQNSPSLKDVIEKTDVQTYRLNLDCLGD